MLLGRRPAVELDAINFALSAIKTVSVIIAVSVIVDELMSISGAFTTTAVGYLIRCPYSTAAQWTFCGDQSAQSSFENFIVVLQIILGW